MRDNRELPDGARQSEGCSELALEQPTETDKSRLGRISRRRKGISMLVLMRAWQQP